MKTSHAAKTRLRAWVGGQAHARYALDHPETVRGLRVLDLAAGCGQAGIAAALAGAASIEANDTDPYARRAIMLNARANGVVVAVSEIDLLDGAGGDAEVVLAGDVFYIKDMAQRVQRFMERVASRAPACSSAIPVGPSFPTTGCSR